jgi:hypothetical protein
MFTISDGKKTVEVPDKIMKSIIRQHLTQISILKSKEGKTFPKADEDQLTLLHKLAFEFNAYY